MSQKIEDEQNNWRNFSPGITWELGILLNVTGKVSEEIDATLGKLSKKITTKHMENSIS